MKKNTRSTSFLKKFKQITGLSLQWGYRQLPLSLTAKLRIKDWVFSTFSFAIKNTNSYRAWRTFRSTNKDIISQRHARLDCPTYAQYAEQIQQLPYHSSTFKSLAKNPVDFKTIKTRAIAFYLPQFHPIPENDRWWGKGFTEWTNVSKSVPQFLGHEQPKLPGELGFYDLRIVDTMGRQAELAKHAGLSGFCFYYYWFDGHRLLETPVQQYLDSKIDFPFCLCWANENWTRRWDGMEQDVLMAQNYSPDDDLAFICSLKPYLTDKRYIRVDGRPLLILYRPSLLPDARATISRWRDYCKSEGIGDLFLCMVQFDEQDPRPYGLDAAIEFPPHKLGKNIPAQNDQLEIVNPDYEGYVVSYDDIIRRAYKEPTPDFPMIRGVFPSWDNEARKPGRGFTTIGSTPSKYRAWLRTATNYALKNKTAGESLVFINAWNEWAEGAYLEPDRRYGYAYLNATQQALTRPTTSQSLQESVLVIIHAFYPELLPEIFKYLEKWTKPFELVITAPPEKEIEIIATLQLHNQNGKFIPFPNRGRDVLPFLQTLRMTDNQYRLILKIHTKKSLHRTDGDLWRRDLLNKLLSKNNANKIIDSFFEYDDLGLVAPSGHLVPMQYFYGSNEKTLNELKNSIGDFSLNMSNELFSAGTMFYVRSTALIPIRKLNLEPKDFEEEQGQIDGTMAHALERYFTISALMSGYFISETDSPHQAAYMPSRDFKYAKNDS